MYKESHLRSILKTISWRFWATLTTISLVLLFTGETAIALSIGGLEVILKMIIYFFHERAWDKVKFGRHEIQPFVLWFTGLPSSGKNEISEKVYQKLSQNGIKVEYLNGQTVRKLFPETGFSKEEVNEHIKRVGHLASQLEKHGIFVVASFISPYKESREFVRQVCKNFLEIHVATPLEYCRKRDKEGLYKLAAEGRIKNLAGVDAPYEEPENPFMRVDLSKSSSDEISEDILQRLKKYL
jgi:adenylylsulfate kinase